VDTEQTDDTSHVLHPPPFPERLQRLRYEPLDYATHPIDYGYGPQGWGPFAQAWNPVDFLAPQANIDITREAANNAWTVGPGYHVITVFPDRSQDLVHNNSLLSELQRGDTVARRSLTSTISNGTDPRTTPVTPLPSKMLATLRSLFVTPKGG